MRCGFVWLREGLLANGVMNVIYHKVRRIFWLTNLQLGSEEQLGCVVLFTVAGDTHFGSNT